MLMKAIDSYLETRRAAGFELEVPEYLLRSFARFARERGDDHVRSATVVEWAGQAPSQGQRHHRLGTVIRFARYIRAEDDRHEVPPTGILGPKRRRRVPFIYTQEQTERLIQAATQLGPDGSLRPHTYSALLALLFSTGMRISEALALRPGDVTSDGLVIRKTKFKKSRLVPLHPTAEEGLSQYLQRRKRVHGCDDHLFVSVRGRGLDRSSVRWTFVRLLESAGLGLGTEGRRPRIHDVRHTFAVRSLRACPEGRDNVGRHMLALSTYLGHANISDTYWYLENTPELMRDIQSASDVFLKGELQ